MRKVWICVALQWVLVACALQVPAYRQPVHGEAGRGYQMPWCEDTPAEAKIYTPCRPAVVDDSDVCTRRFGEICRRGQ